MKTPGINRASIFVALIGALLLCVAPVPMSAQSRVIRGGSPDMPPGMPMPGPDSSSSSSKSDSSGKSTGPWIPSEPLTSSGNTNDDIQLSFQGANIDMIVQWLMQTTGKTVIKNSAVQCQLTITSSKKVSTREAINMVYSALALEGVTAIESSKRIILVPQGKEPRMSPELLPSGQKEIPEGRQFIMQAFSLQHVQAGNIKDKVQAALSDKATITIDDHANQIIISDYNDNIRVVGELIAALDSDHPENVSIRVIPLKNIGALDFAKELAPLYQKISGKNPGDTIDITADDRSNSLIVLSSAANFVALEKIITSLDTEDAQEKVTKTFVLKNADAPDVAKQLQDLGQDPNDNNRYGYFWGGSSSSSAKAGKKMSVVADRRRNALVVQAPPAQMDSIGKMIAELDEPIADDSLAPKIFRLKYVSAVDIEDVLNELFLKKQQSRSYWDYVFDNPDSGSSGQDAGRLYGKVRITSEPYANAIIVTSNSKENLDVVEDVLNQLDQPSDQGESTLRVELRYAKAQTIANGINILFARNGSPAVRGSTQQNQTPGNNTTSNQGQQQSQSSATQTGFDLAQEIKEDGYYPWLGGQGDGSSGGGRFGGGSSTTDRSSMRPVSDLVGRVRAVADERGNAVLVSANVHYFPQILKLLDQLDTQSDQVLIDARIVEVSSDFLDKLGVRYSPDGSKVFTADDFDNSFLASATATYMKGFGGNTTVNSPSSSTVAQALTSLRSGVLSSSINMDFLVQFLRKTTDATVLDEPQITINNNETGKLFVGQQVPTPANTQVSSVGSQNTAIVYKDVGVVLEVTPHINNSGDVHLKVHAESSTVVAGDIVLGGPVFDTRNFRTDLSARNGETLILGGIIQKQISDTLRKTPILGDIPLLGWVFKKKDKTTREVELMVFLRPKVIRSPEDGQDLLDEINRKAPRMQKWEQDSLPKNVH